MGKSLHPSKQRQCAVTVSEMRNSHYKKISSKSADNFPIYFQRVHCQIEKFVIMQYIITNHYKIYLFSPLKPERIPITSTKIF